MPMRESLLVAMVTFAAACGGKVVFDAGAGGAGGASPTSTSTHAATNGTSGSGAAPCATFCAAEVSAGCAVPASGCEHVCEVEQAYAGPCASLAADLRACIVAKGFPSAPQCIDFQGCEAQQKTFTACEYPPGGCMPSTCVDAMGERACSTTCGPHVYASQCKATAPPSACTCLVDGTVVGTCTDELSSSGECCIALFAQTK